MTADKRAAPRFRVAVAAEVELGGRVLVASTNDISTGGVGLVLDRALPEAGTVKLQLFLTQDGIEDPDQEPLEAKAKVMWCAEREGGSHAAGVRFTSLSAAQERQLEQFLAAVG